MQGYTEHHITFWERKIILSNADEIYISMAMKISFMTTYSLIGGYKYQRNILPQFFCVEVSQLGKCFPAVSL